LIQIAPLRAVQTAPSEIYHTIDDQQNNLPGKARRVFEASYASCDDPAARKRSTVTKKAVAITRHGFLFLAILAV
jgi:hypothetical protein